MASFNYTGVDEAIRELKRMGADISKKASAAAVAGGKAAVAEMEKRVPVRTGGLQGHITVSQPNHTTADGYYVDVGPTGTKKNGRKRERYETVGYVLEYGRSNMEARPWLRPAMEEGEEAIASAMADVLLE